MTLDGRRAAAVAVVLLPDEGGEACFLLTKRAVTLRSHTRQWAFPGGGVDPGETAEAAALRELAEEVGLVRDAAAILGCLDDYPTRSGYVITPVILWGGEVGPLAPNPAEVGSVHRIPLVALEAPGVPTLVTIPESDRPVIQIPLVDSRIHAPTGAILYQLREVVVHGRATRVDHFEQPVWAWR